MRTEVSTAIEELGRQFDRASLSVREDDKGGAYVIIEPVTLGSRYRPESTWMGFHIPAQYPYADIYPVFIGAECCRADGRAFVAPITPGHQFEGRAAIQVSRRSPAAVISSQNAIGKVLKIIRFLETLP
jgi:hypothetical protein